MGNDLRTKTNTLIQAELDFPDDNTYELAARLGWPPTALTNLRLRPGYKTRKRAVIAEANSEIRNTRTRHTKKATESLIKAELADPKASDRELALQLGIKVKTITSIRRTRLYELGKHEAVANQLGVDTGKKPTGETADQVIEKAQLRASQVLVLLMEDGRQERIRLEAAESLLDRGGHPKGFHLEKTDTFQIAQETRDWLDDVLSRHEKVVGAVHVEDELRRCEIAAVGELVPVLPDSNRA